MSWSADLLYLATIIACIWLAGCLLLAALTVLPATRQNTVGLWPLMLSEAAILLAGVLPWLLPRPVLMAALAVAALRIGYESAAVHAASASAGQKPQSGLIGAVILLAMAAAAWFLAAQPLATGFAVLSAILVVVVIMATRVPSFGWVWRFFLFPALPFGLFVYAAHWPALAAVFLLSFLLVEIFDSFSLLGGRLFGKHKLVPKLSPKKTWEGLFTGVAAVILAALLLSSVLTEKPLVIVAIAAASALAALVGDLTASAAKRRAGVKDYPVILPIQGGLLDIMDGWIVAGPLAALTVALIQ